MINKFHGCVCLWWNKLLVDFNLWNAPCVCGRAGGWLYTVQVCVGWKKKNSRFRTHDRQIDRQSECLAERTRDLQKISPNLFVLTTANVRCQEVDRRWGQKFMAHAQGEMETNKEKKKMNVVDRWPQPGVEESDRIREREERRIFFC